jgi:hypothetical protein
MYPALDKNLAILVRRSLVKFAVCVAPKCLGLGNTEDIIEHTAPRQAKHTTIGFEDIKTANSSNDILPIRY